MLSQVDIASKLCCLKQFLVAKIHVLDKNMILLLLVTFEILFTGSTVTFYLLSLLFDFAQVLFVLM